MMSFGQAAVLCVNLGLTCIVYAQKAPPSVERAPVHGNVHFEFTHSMRVSDYHVTIDFYDRPWLKADTIEVRAISGHGWQKSASDTAFTISIAEYERIVSAVNGIRVPKLSTLDGLSIVSDGYTCVIEYGDLNSVAIEVWVPREGEEPQGFYAACKLILEVGGFDPKKILGR